MKILLLEDDASMASHLVKALNQLGNTVDWVTDGREGLIQATSQHYDVLVLDRMVSGLDGLGLVKAVRAAKVATPILFLTALGGVDDRVEGLEAGGDDYLVKPFAFSELVARLNALGRRPPTVADNAVLKVGDLEMNLITRKVARAGTRIDLQPREFRLLEVLMRNRGRVMTRTMLLERVWDFHFDPKTSVVETHISRLRTKVDKPFSTELIHTERGMGYVLDAA
jgi:two-component system, OmpR family, response regulator